jgi:phage baseplate assembly protein gpV
MRIQALCAFVFAIVASDMFVRPMSLSELCEGSGRVVAGTVKSVDATWDAGRTRIETTVQVDVTETFKGSQASTVSVKVPGGRVGDVVQHVGDAPIFATGEKVVCFLRNDGAASEVYGWFRGKFTVIGDKVREVKGETWSAFRSSIQTLCGKR